MTKKRVGLLLIAFVMLGFYFFRDTQQSPSSQVVSVSPSSVKNKETSVPTRKVIDHKKDPLTRLPASVSYANKPSSRWQKKLETNLRAQASDNLKQVWIKKENSLVWTRDDNALMVESVVVRLTNKQDEESSFRALVDSETGKILETWDRSISDPANVRGGFRFKLDPRYSN